MASAPVGRTGSYWGLTVRRMLKASLTPPVIEPRHGPIIPMVMPAKASRARIRFPFPRVPKIRFRAVRALAAAL